MWGRLIPLRPEAGVAGICLGLGVGTGSTAARASSWGCKPLGTVSAHSLLTPLFRSTGVKMYTGLSAREEVRICDGRMGRRQNKQEKGLPSVGGEGLLVPWKLRLGQTELDLHPNTVLISGQLCLNSLILWGICWAPL